MDRNIAIVHSGEEYDPETQRVYTIGQTMPDKTKFAGISPDMGCALFTSADDAPLTYTFSEARKYAEELNRQKAYGYNDWRVPSKSELNVLFTNRAAIGGFNLSGSSPAGWYRSSSQHNHFSVWGQRFSDGYQVDDMIIVGSLRCVRG